MKRYTQTELYPKQIVTQSHPVSPGELFEPSVIFTFVQLSNVFRIKCVNSTNLWPHLNAGDVFRICFHLGMTKQFFVRKKACWVVMVEVWSQSLATSPFFRKFEIGCIQPYRVAKQTLVFVINQRYSKARFLEHSQNTLCLNQLWAIHIFLISLRLLGLVIENSEDQAVLFSSYRRLISFPGIQL